MAERIAGRFERPTDPDACALWTGRVDGSGYPEIRDDEGRIIGAHRAVWILADGPIPDGMQVLHTCADRYPPGDRTSRRCGNRGHLKLGTNAENVADRVRQGRESDHAGEANGRAKLNAERVRLIRRGVRAGVAMSEFARAYGVTLGAIWFAATGLTWRRVPLD